MHEWLVHCCSQVWMNLVRLLTSLAQRTPFNFDVRLDCMQDRHTAPGKHEALPRGWPAQSTCFLHALQTEQCQQPHIAQQWHQSRLLQAVAPAWMDLYHSCVPEFQALMARKQRHRAVMSDAIAACCCLCLGRFTSSFVLHFQALMVCKQRHREQQ